MLVIGLMSGTSADAVDAALVRWPEGVQATPFELVAYREYPHPPALQAEIHRLAAGELPGEGVLAELARLDVLLGERFAEAALGIIAESGVAAAEIDAIASHGQTVAHHPEHRASLQIGCPARIADRTGLPVIADFRRRDLAAGGEGAPLAPFFHHAVLSEPGEGRGILNLGGIANLTWLPPSGDPSEVIAFDTGPANSLIDGVVALATGGAERMDVGGRRAARGQVHRAWLAELMEDDYLASPPPKSTGRERYGAREARAFLERAEREGLAFDDLVATLAAFTIESVVDAAHRHLPDAPGSKDGMRRLLVGGGGAQNPVLMEGLADALPGVVVEAMDEAGVPSAACEAMAFSLMGRNALLGLPNHLPPCTGAERLSVLGSLNAGALVRER